MRVFRPVMIFGLRTRRPQEPSRAERIYAVIAAQARAPGFFRDHGVPDTLPGRFEMVVLHAVLYFHRLRDESAEAKAVGQEVFDVMFREMDAALREFGVGDISVPKAMKAMTRSFYDGAAAYDRALDSRDDQALTLAVARNVFGDAASSASGAPAVAAYARRAADALALQQVDALTAHGPEFPPLEEADR
jgi:cytochrome b pre-mRNA-processing protein 3